MTNIIVTHENNEVDEHDFEPEIRTITIGRRSTNDVCVANLSVSGTHAKIMLSETGALVEDLNSTNGTYINGRLISRQLLNDGDDIVMGRVRITYVAAPKHPDQIDNEMFDDPLTLTEKPDQQTLDAIGQTPDSSAQQVSARGSRLANSVTADSEVAQPYKSATLSDSAVELSDDLAGDMDDDMPVLTPIRDARAQPRRSSNRSNRSCPRASHRH